MPTKKIARLVWYEDDGESAVRRTADTVGRTFYLELLDHPHNLVPGVVAQSIDIHGLISGYEGPRLTLDFDKDHRPIGIEILYSTKG